MALPKYLYFKHPGGLVLSFWLKDETDTEWIAISPYRVSTKMVILKNDPHVVGTGDAPHPDKNGLPNMILPRKVMVKEGTTPYGVLAGIPVKVAEDFRKLPTELIVERMEAPPGANRFSRSMQGRPAAGVPASISVRGGNLQRSACSAGFDQPLTVLVLDVDGTPVVGATVDFSAPASGATAALSSASATTGSDGMVAVTATASETPGTYNVVAAVHGTGLMDSFSLANGNPQQWGKVRRALRPT